MAPPAQQTQDIEVKKEQEENKKPNNDAEKTEDVKQEKSEIKQEIKKEKEDFPQQQPGLIFQETIKDSENKEFVTENVGKTQKAELLSEENRKQTVIQILISC